MMLKEKSTILENSSFFFNFSLSTLLTHLSFTDYFVGPPIGLSDIISSQSAPATWGPFLLDHSYVI